MPATARLLPFSPATITLAADLIARGQPVAVPTETVYGLAGDATDGAAVAAIYAAKGRPAFNPLIVHVADLPAACALADLDATALRLAEAFWPGPLTIVARLRPDAQVARLATAGLATIALRVPAHPVMQAVLRAVGLPLAAPSANASGSISPTRAVHVVRSLGDRIPLVVDGGACPLGLESTIVATGASGVRLLRPGPIGVTALARIAGLPVPDPVWEGGGTGIEAPGQLLQHYAPSKPVRLRAVEPLAGEWLIGFGPVAGHDTLSSGGDLREAAARLFDTLHAADASDLPRIAVAPVPERDLGIAINDRLARAAA